jgi:tetratricopeptide (TPR) repeat protein
VKLDVGKAIECYERAIAINASDPRLFLELDTLYESGNVSPERRLAVLEKHHTTVAKRQDSFTREIQVLVLAGRYDQAIEHLANNRFHAREGSERIHDVFVDAHLLRGLGRLREKRYKDALDDFERAADYPENLSVGRPKNDPRAAQVAYCTALAWEGLGNAHEARAQYEKAAGGANGADPPEARFYRAQALAKLGRHEQARRIFDGLIQTARERLAAGETSDFFAKFGEREAKRSRIAAAHYLLGLGYLGNGQIAQAREAFRQAVTTDAAHVWARYQASAVE